MVAARIAVDTAKHTAVVGIDTVLCPKPAINKFLLIENGFVLFFDKLSHFFAPFASQSPTFVYTNC